MIENFFTAIADGNNGTIEEFPYQVQIENKNSKYLCGGTIISKNWIITAAHLCATESAKNLKIRAGSDLREKGGSLHQVDKIIKHEKSGFKNDIVPVNDIALIRVREPFELDKSRQVIQLFEKDEKSENLAKVSGFGVVKDGYYLGELAENLQWVEIPLIERDYCDKMYQYKYEGLPEGTICAGENDIGGKNACKGDEGSPLAIDGRLAGVVSWSYNCADPYYPPVYTEIAYYRDWIDEHLKV